MKIVFEGNQEEVIAEIIAMALVLAPVKMGTKATLVHIGVDPGAPEGDFSAKREPVGAEVVTDPIDENPSGRKPGFPEEGKKRRTKAQIAADEEYFAEQEENADLGREKPDADIDTSGKAIEDKIDPAEGGTAHPTLDDVRNKLKMVVSMTSMKRGQELVAEFEASRITELPEEKFAAFIARCEVVVEEG